MRKLVPVLFDDRNPGAAREQRESVAQGDARERTADDLPVHRLSGLLAELRTLAANQMRWPTAALTFTIQSAQRADGGSAALLRVTRYSA